MRIVYDRCIRVESEQMTDTTVAILRCSMPFGHKSKCRTDMEEITDSEDAA